MAVHRILREIRDVIQSEEIAPCGINVELFNASIFELKGEITGPPDTPYEGGKFKLKIKLPSNYPFKPPQVRFLTKVWHANISSNTGAVCLNNILIDQWSPAFTLKSVLLSVKVLLSSPEPENQLDLIVARQFRENQEVFKLTAFHWTNVYAGGPCKNQSFDDKVRTLTDLLGLCENFSRAFLSSCNWDLEYAINKLVSTRSDCANNTSYNCEDDQSENDQSNDNQSEGDQSEEDRRKSIFQLLISKLKLI